MSPKDLISRGFDREPVSVLRALFDAIDADGGLLLRDRRASFGSAKAAAAAGSTQVGVMAAPSG